MPSPPKPVLRGENCPLTIFVNRVRQQHADVCKSIKISQDAVQHRDQYNGRTRAENDKQVDGYSATIEMDMYDSTLLDALLAQDAAREANQPIPEIVVLVTLNNRDGARQAYYLRRCVSKHDLNFGGRTESVGQSLDIKAEDLVKAV